MATKLILPPKYVARPIGIISPIGDGTYQAPNHIEQDEYSFVYNSLQRWADRKFQASFKERGRFGD